MLKPLGTTTLSGPEAKILESAAKNLGLTLKGVRDDRRG